MILADAIKFLGHELPSLPSGGRFWAGLVPIVLALAAGAWKGRGKIGETLTNLRSRLAPAASAGPAREPVAQAIVVLGEHAKQTKDSDMAAAAVRAFEAFVKVDDPEVTP